MLPHPARYRQITQGLREIDEGKDTPIEDRTCKRLSDGDTV